MTLGLRPLALPDEGRYVGVAWEMVRNGHWLVPTLDGMPYFHKPPLFYWVTAASLKAFGLGLAATRAASWLAAVALCAGIFAFVRRWAEARLAWRSVSVLATLPLFYGGAQFANPDMLVASCIALSVLAFVHAMLAVENGDNSARWAAASGFAAAAAGVLAKGLIGVVLPALVLTCWSALTSRTTSWRRLAAWAPGWTLFISICAPWFIAMQDSFDGFADYFFVVQHVERFVGSAFNNVQPIWFYVPVLLLGAMPWSASIAASWRVLIRAESPRRRDLRLLAIVWIACVTGFFSWPQSKLVGYILPALAPLGVLAALCLESVASRLFRLGIGLSGVACIVAAALVAHAAPKSHAPVGRELLALRQPGDAVVFVDDYFFDIPFYAQLTDPVLVVDRWLPGETAKDSWRRELLDARTFSGVAGTPRLLHPEELATRLCAAARTAWIVGPTTGASVDWLAGIAPMRVFGQTALRRLDAATPEGRAALRCSRPLPAALS
ncbi:MAG TPA: glycosyltransferase family 39 protein [Burkholderiaceae bacterium]|nr:glycosyltransferase family 39 protein [Burkholderiaceae bacterium]